ncbi:MAG: hypothetical protein K2Z81_03080, partial [Cyanobacteria bacterium]|nr:hypothetical protein [Cyanobacteriota bacterium]
SNPSASVGTNRVETPARSEVNGAGNNPRTELTSNPERTNPATGSSTSAESRDTTRPSSYEQNGTSISGGNRAQISSTSEGRTAVPAASHEAGYTSTPAPSANNFDATVARPSTRSAVTTGDSTVAGSAVDENRNNSRAGVAPTPASASAQPSTSPRAANPGASNATGSRQLNQTGSFGSNTQTYRDTTSAPTTRTGSTTSASTTREREDEEERVIRLGRTTEDSNDNNARTGYAAPSAVEAQPTVRPPVRVSGSTPGSLLRDTAPGRNDTAPVAPVADRINSILTNGKQVTSTSDGVTTRNARPANTMNDAIQGSDATRVRSINNSGTPSGRVVFDATQTGRRVVASDVNNSTPAGAGRSQGPSIVADTTNVGTNRGQGAQGTDGGTIRGQGVPGVTNGIEFNTTGNRGQGTQGIDVVNVGTGRPQGTSSIEAGISGANRGQGSQASDLIVLGNGRSQRVYGIDISTTGARSQGQGIQGIELINVGTARPQGTDTTRGQGSQGIDQLTPGTSRTQRNPGAIGNDITSGAAGRGPGSLPGLTGLNGTNMTVAGGRVPGNIDTTIGAAGRVPGIHGIDLTNGRAPGIQGIDLTAVGAGRVPGNYGTDATNGTAGRVPGIQGSDMTGGRVSGLQGMDATAGRVPSVHGIDMTGSGRTPGAQGIDATTGRVIPGIQGIQNIQLDPTGTGRRGDVTASGVTLDPVTGKPIQDPQGRGVINPVGAVRVPNSLVGNIRTIDMQTTADGLGITNGLTGRVLVDGIRNQVGIAGRAIDARTIRLENGRVMGVNDRYMTGLEMALLMGLAGITLIRGRGNRIEGRNWSMARRGREFVIFVDGRKAPFKIGRSIGECKDLTGTFRRQLNDTVADGRKTQLSTLTMDRVSKLGTLRTGSNGTLRFERGLKTAGDALKLGGRQATLGASDLYNASRSRYPGGVELAMLMSLTGFGKMTGLENILQKPGDKLDLSSMSAADRFRLLSMTAGSLPLMAGQFGLGGTPFGGKEDGVFDDKEIDFQERLEAYLRELGLSALTSEGEDFDEQSEETEETYEEEQDEFSPPTVVFMRPKMMIGPGQTLEQIAESRYDDPDVAWLIADLNRHVMRESFLNGKRIVEFRSRQEIELPVFEDVQLFYRNRKKGQDSENLVTVIAERQIDREVVEHALNKVIGV